MASSSADMSFAEDLEASKFDFVVVGGGTAGLVVAARLTENPDIKVLVLEAGADRRQDPRIKIQGICLSTYFDPDFDWCLSTEPQVRCAVLLQFAAVGRIIN
jgi:choline dehydrogenase-like flavoprotein